jgi:spermidine synthase
MDRWATIRAERAGAESQAMEKRGVVAREDAQPDRAGRIVLVAFLGTGFCALAVEVIWTRVLTLVIGTTVYAFSTMLGTFLLGLGLGSWVFARVAQRTSRPGLVFGLLVGAIGAGVFGSSALFGRLPILYMSYYESFRPTWGGFVWIQFLLSFFTMLGPAFLMGGTFPLVTRIYARDPARVGRRIGTAYAFNTVGAILGSVAASLVMMRYLGIEGSLRLITAVYLGISLALLLTLVRWQKTRLKVATGAAVVVVAALLLGLYPGWDKEVMTGGVYRYFGVYENVEGFKEALAERHLLFYDEGPGATISVSRIQNELSLYIDGKADASTGFGDMSLFVLQGHLPLLLHPEPDTILVIGLGSGLTLGAVERHSIEHVDCVELLEGVVEAARYFDPYNHDCLGDPRLRLIAGDGRNHVSLSGRTYDAIISEPTNPWISGVGDLFTEEFFEMARQSLKPGGIMCGWFHTYHMGEEDVKTVIKTFSSAFSHTSLWMASETDLILIGSSEPLAFGEKLRRHFGDTGVRSDLERIWIDEPEDILSSYLAGGESLRRFVASRGRLNTDDNMLLEFSAGRKLAKDVLATHLSGFAGLMEPLPPTWTDDETRRRVMRQRDARKTVMMASLARDGGDLGQALDLYGKAFSLSSSDPYVLPQYVMANLVAGDMLLAEGRFQRAASHYRKAIVEPHFPDMGRGYHGLGVCAYSLGDFESAYDHFRRAIAKNPYSVPTQYAIGKLEEQRGDFTAALRAYEKVIELSPDHADASAALARLGSSQGQ